MNNIQRLFFIGVVLLISSAANQGVCADNFNIIAHRGASGFLPEHTLEATTLAFSQRPNYIEQDVVFSKDSVAVVLHDIHLETVTDVEQQFPHRARDDGRFYARDFTLKELRSLRIHERENAQGERIFKQRYSGTQAHFTIATLEEHFEVITQLNRQFNTNVGVYTEIKSPQWHKKEGVDSSKIVISTMQKYGFDRKEANSFLQCFDFNEIKRIRSELGYQGKLVMLIGENSWGESSTDYNWLKSEHGLKEVAKYANGIGPWIGQLFDNDHLAQGELVSAKWLSYARQNNLLVHPYTYRKDALPLGMTSNELLAALVHQVKADGIFTDHIPEVKQWLEQQKTTSP